MHLGMEIPAAACCSAHPAAAASDKHIADKAELSWLWVEEQGTSLVQGLEPPLPAGMACKARLISLG